MYLHYITVYIALYNFNSGASIHGPGLVYTSFYQEPSLENVELNHRGMDYEMYIQYTLHTSVV